MPTVLTHLKKTDIKDSILSKISWSHHMAIFSRCKVMEECKFYITRCIQENYSFERLKGRFRQVYLNVPLWISIAIQSSLRTPCLFRKSMLPVISNQRMNGYFKEIADVCGLKVSLIPIRQDGHLVVPLLLSIMSRYT